MSTTVYTVCVNDFAPKVTAITFPLMESYAKKIGAKFKVLTERKFPDMPPNYEKFQLYQESREFW